MSNSENYTKRWIGDGAVNFVKLENGLAIRYLNVGSSKDSAPILILMHTARSQLDYFQRLIPLLRGQYRIYAVDLPGHGWSEIDKTVTYDEPFLRQSMVSFIKTLGLKDVTLCGDSVGAVLALTISTEIPKLIKQTISVNLFDYQEGVRRANFIANFVLGFYTVPGVRHIITNMENKIILGAILRGGFKNGKRLPNDLLKEFRRVGRRKGYSAVVRSIFGAMPSFVNAKKLYGSVSVPATLIYGETDWATAKERQANQKAVPGAKFISLENTGHFASLENPNAIAKIVNGLADL